uniref:Uncharacterized protein n=1 Tax=Leersia perrieri TaxID=77586 RepID=A0A0D9WM60_9ORYZ
MEGAIFSVTEGTVRSLLCKLGSLLSQENWFVQGVRGDIQYIKDELESMNAFLRNLAILEDYDNQVRIWMKQVREIAYDAEDCIDDFTHHLGESPGIGFLRQLIYILGKLCCRRRIAMQLQELKARAQEASDRRERYGVMLPKTTLQGAGPRPTKHASRHLDPQLHALFTEEAQLVGLDEPRDELVHWVMEDVPCQRVLAIVGFGGLGKTTLARMVCESPMVKGADFQCCPLFIVSQTFNIRTLFQYMIRELIQRPNKAMAVAGGKHGHTTDRNLDEMGRWEVAVLAEKLRQYLKDKRYIVIFDDIWTISAWESIKCALPDNNMGSRVILTTRNEDVANTCCSHPQDRIYKMQLLSDTASRELFFKRIFGSADISSNDELEEVSNSILKKCGGLPLAIVSIGSLLASKTNRTKEEWQKICDNLGSELDTNPTLEVAKQVLTLSYNDLPYHLKACFLYLSIFPENYVIRRGPLVRRWIAEGFVNQRHGLSMEEIAESYFDEFVARSIVQPVRIDWSGKVRTCRVHDMMLEVIISKSLEDNFASLLCDNGHPLVSHDKIRRLSIHNSHNSLQRTKGSVSHVRSFTMSASIEEVPMFFAQMRLLRVLDLQGSSCVNNNTLNYICKFSQLKYLTLRKTNVCKLPRLIGNLKHLETLDIRATLIRKLPASASNLSCLKHLLVGHKVQLTRTSSVKCFRPHSGLEMATGVVKNMIALQSLAHVVVKEQPSVLREICQLQNLQKLNVLFRGMEENWKAFLESLGKLVGSLRSLSIHILDEKEYSSSLDKLDGIESPPLFIKNFSLKGKLQRLPAWISLLRNVSRITLRDTGPHAEAIGVLGDLPNLLCLKLYRKAYADDCIIFAHGKLILQLRMLVIDNMENIRNVHFEKGSVPNLEWLTIAFVREPKDGISGLENLLNLKEIEFFGDIILSMATKVASCMKDHANHPRVIGDNWNIGLMEGAIVSLTEGAVRGLLQKLGGILAQESSPAQRVHSDVQYIKDELESMNAFLRNVSTSEVAGHDDQVRVWMKQVREIAYDAEDCIDVFVHQSHLASDSEKGSIVVAFLRRLARRLLVGERSSVVVQLQQLKARARDAGERRTRYGVSLAQATEALPRRMSGRLDPRLHALFTEEAQLVAIDGPRDELVGWVMEEEPQLRVLAIVGFGGLGKTTLVRMVYGSPRVKGADFQCSPPLVVVSQTFSIRALFQHMLRELIQLPPFTDDDGDRVAADNELLQGMESWETAALASKLREYLQDKRYIVILDDIWSSSAWESIKCAFPDNKKGSRIIVTTRNEDVANTCCCRPQDRIYKIKQLSDAASRELFFMRIFGMADGALDDELKQISDSILKKCGGLPLAIVSIGSLLASKPNRSKEEWQKVRDYLGSELETNPTLEGTKQVLTLSYNDLPYHLKACFLYLSMFPENHVIKRGQLIRMWIAEGFVTQRHGLSMEQVGERYFDEFVSRSMVHPVRIDWSGKVRSCRVHDIMLEVIVSKSLEENFASFFCDNGND